jgi:hypothetical protein
MTNITFKKGQRVWWNDPEDGIQSDYYTIMSDVQKDLKELQANGGDDTTISDDLIILLSHKQGGETQACINELDPVYEGEDWELFERESVLQQDMQASILQHLRQNNGRITLQLPSNENDDMEDFEFPVSMILSGRHDNNSVHITDVYINQGNSGIYADGLVDDEKHRGYTICPEHYSDVLLFITLVLYPDE